MKNKAAEIVWLALACAVFAFAASCRHHHRRAADWTTIEDGTYRGVFIDRDSIQVNVEFSLTDGAVTEAQFRHLRRDDDYYLGTQTEPYSSVITQYQEALDYLVGKNLQDHLADLYEPEEVLETEVDGYTAATVRTGKVISAVRDGVNRGVYSY